MAFRDYNAPYFPLSGESAFGLTFQTTNADLARFELEGRKLTSNDDNRYDWIFNMHIPGLTFGKRLEANSTFQFLNEGKYLSVTSGIHGYKFGKFEAKYNNITNGFHTKFSTPELAYLQPITIESEVFNQTNPGTNEQDIGLSINATYKKLTIQEVVTLFRHNDQYGFKSNLTYWPRKHVTTEGRISLVKKSLYLKMGDTNSKTKLFFAGKLGQSTNKFYVKVGNDIMKSEVKLNGEVNLKQRKILLDMFTKPSGNLMKFEAYPSGNAVDNGFYVRLLHANSSSQMTGYLGSSNTDTEATLKFNGTAMKQPFYIHLTRFLRNHERGVELVAAGFGNTANSSLSIISMSSSIGLKYFASLNDKTLSSKVAVFKHPREMGLKLHAALLGKTAGVQVAYFHNGQNHGLHLKLTGADKTVDTIATYFTRDEEKGLNFTVRGMDRSANMIWAYYTGKVEAGLKMSASIQDKSVEIAAGLFRYDNERGLRVKANVLEREMEARWSILSGSRFGVKFAANAMKKNIELKSTFFNKKHLKEWRVDAVYGGKTTSLVSTYITLPSEKSLCSEVTDSKTVHFRVCTKLLKYTDENALQLGVEALGRKAEVRASLIHTATEKGGQLRMMYNDALFSDVFVGVGTTPSSTGLRIRGNIKEKSFDALLTYKNTHLKRAVDLQLRVLGNQVSFETVLVREQSLQGVQVNAVYQNQPAGSAYILISRKLASKFLKIGLRTAHKNGIYYKLSTTTSRIEKMLASMMFVRVNQKHYKYGWSVHYGNKGTSQEPSYLVTTKLHYARNKALTSIYQMINTYQMFNLLSKVELAPGQFLVNKFTYSKPSRNVFVQYELLPGIGITYNAAFVNTDQHLSLKSTMTILDYALKDSIALDRETGQLKIKFMYCPAFPPVEITSHLRVKNGVNMGFALTASNMTWNPTLLMDYSSKQMKLTFDVLPKVPIHMFAKIFDHKQFLLNLTTSAFSVQLAGERSTKDEYMLILKHQYLQNVFEDFKLTINSLYDLHKLQLKWDTKMAVEFLRRTNMSMRKLLNGTVTVLLKMSDTATKMATNGVNYMQSSGRNTLLRMMDSFETQMNMIKELLKGVKLNELIKKYSTSVTEMIKKIKGNLFKMVDEVKRYGTPLLGTFDELQKTVKEMAIELSPHLRSLSSDVRSWLSRSVNRYAAISICGRTVQEMAKEIMEKTRVFSKLFADRCMKQATLLVSKINEMKIVTKELLHHVKKLKMTLDEFTCNYDIKCTSSKVQNKLKELINFVPRIENWLKQLNRRFEKISEQLIEQYKTGERFVSTMVEDMELRQKAKELLKPITDFLKTIILSIERKMIPLHDKVREMANKLKNSGEVYFDEMKLKSDEIVKTVEKVSKFVARHLTIAKDKLLDKIQETKASFEIIQTKGLEMYKKLMEKMQELKTMSWEEIHVFVKDGITMNYKNLRQQCELLSRNVVVKVEEILKGHATEFEKVKKIGKEIYAVSADAMNGRVTLKQARDKFSLLVHKILKVLQEQGKEALDKIKALKLIEHVMKAKTATINFYKETKHDLVKRATALYPKVMTELKNIVEKVKIIVKEYVELAKLRIDNLRQKQMVHLDKIVRKVKEIKLEIVHKAYELADHYKKLGSEQLSKKMMELKSLIKVYETMLKEAAHNYKNILTTFTAKQYQKIREEVLDMATLYQDMPMEDILKELRKKMSVEVNKVLGTVIEGVLSIYQRAFTYAKQTKMLYQDNFHLLAAKWNTISNIAREMNVKYQAMAKKQFQDVCRYYSEDIEPLINVYLAKIEKICNHALSYSKARYDLLKLWYEKVKHMKFKEFYFKAKELLQDWTKEWKKYQESYEVKVNEWKGKINHFIEEVKEESKKVVSRVKKANEAVQQDAITTFSPYEPLLKNILQKHKGLSTLKLAALRNNYKELFELITDNRKTAEIYMNMFQKKLTVPDFDRKEIASNILKYLNGYPLLADAMESIESIKDGRLMTQVMQSLNKCPFIADVRNHELWRVLKQEFFNHELVIASQELGKSSFNKLRELCSEFYAHSISILRELGRQIATKATGMKEDLLARNDLVKNQLKQTHSELKIKLRYVHDQFKSKGEKFLHRSLDMYNSGQKTIVTNIENLGEMSLYDVQIRATKCFENLLAPLKSTYNDVSDFVEKQLQILAEQQNAIKERAARLHKRVMIIVADSKTWLNNMYKKSTEWTVTTWTNRKSDIADLVKLAQKFGDDFEKLTASTLFTCKELVHEYIAYKDFLRMTPNQLIQRVKEMPTKSCEAARRITESLKSAIVDRLRLFLRATMNFIGSINSNTLRQAQIQTEVGVQMTRSVLEDTVKQLHFIVTEILETALFLNKFYVEDTLYSRRPEFLDHVDYQIRLLVNCTHVCKATTMRVFNKTSKMLAEIFHYGVSNIGDLFRNRLPEFIKYLREVKAEMDTRTIQELTNKVKTLQKQYHRLTVEYIKTIYAKTISMLNGSYQKLENYLKLSKSQAISRFNLAKDNAIDFLKTDVREVVSQAYRMILPTSNNIKAFCQKQCTEIMVLLEKLNEKYPFITKHINAVRIADLPVMLKKARGKLPLLWNTMTKDLTTLVNDAVENLIRIASSVRVHVTMLEKYTYLKFNHYGESMEKMINQLHKTTKDVVHVIRINAKDNLPRVIRYIRVDLPVIFIQTVGNVTKYAVQTIQQIEIAIDSGELNLTLPRLDALYEIGTGMKNSFDKHCIDAARLVRKTITEVYPRITVFYQDTLKKSNEILGQLKEGALTNCKKVKQDVITFYKLKLTSLRQLTERFLTSMRTSLKKNLDDMREVTVQTLKTCETMTTIYYKKAEDIFEAAYEVDIGQTIANYTRMLSERKNKFVNIMKSRVTEMVNKLVVEIQKMRTQAIEMNDKIMETVKHGKISMEKQLLNYYKSTKINHYVDIEDLMNKTIEISEDVINLSLIQDALRIGSMCYRESKRLFDQIIESSEFALYIAKHAVKHNDLWGIVQELTNPFHWVPPSNSKYTFRK